MKSEKVTAEEEVNGDEVHCYFCEGTPLFVQFEYVDLLHTRVFYSYREHRIHRTGVSCRALVRPVQNGESSRNGKEKPVEFKKGLVSNKI